MLNLFVVLQVSALDKGSGKSHKITITADKGRFSQDEIDRMVREAEENAETDAVQRRRVEAKNGLEAYLYGLRTSLQDSSSGEASLKSKLQANGDFDTLQGIVTSGLQWLEEHASDSEESINAKKAEIESQVAPILAKTQQPQHQSADNDTSSSSSADNASSQGATAEELWVLSLAFYLVHDSKLITADISSQFFPVINTLVQ